MDSCFPGQSVLKLRFSKRFLLEVIEKIEKTRVHNCKSIVLNFSFENQSRTKLWVSRVQKTNKSITSKKIPEGIFIWFFKYNKRFKTFVSNPKRIWNLSHERHIFTESIHNMWKKSFHKRRLVNSVSFLNRKKETCQFLFFLAPLLVEGEYNFGFTGEIECFLAIFDFAVYAPTEVQDIASRSSKSQSLSFERVVRCILLL